MTTDALDTNAVKGTAPYWNRVASCGCRSVPDGQHIPPCKYNHTPKALRCTVCKLHTATTQDNRCGFCGNKKD